MEYINPFSVVKATEYSDEEILSTWVPFIGSDGVDAIQRLLNPTELMPKYILGSKGCGKTHILRYFSYELRIKGARNIKDLLSNDKYIGIYSRLDGLTASRFNHSDDEQTWVALYDFYFEIFQAIRFLTIAKDILSRLKITYEKEITNSIFQFFNIESHRSSLNDVIAYFNQKRIIIDKAIIDYAYTHTINWDDIKPFCNFGDIIFNIPNILVSKVPELKNIKIIFILDEYEKLPCEWQKISLNTLVYEKKGNVTFWIGARRYGYTTQQTKALEPIREGSEYQPIILDEQIRLQGDKTFLKFAFDLIKKRLQEAGVSDCRGNDISILFEEFNEDKFLSSLSNKANLKHWTKLKANLNKIFENEIQIKSLLEYLQIELKSDGPLSEKFVLFLFYQKWAKQKTVTFVTLNEAAKEAINEFRHNGRKVQEKLNKFRNDFLAQLAVENGINSYVYAGLKQLITISDFNPRILLTLLKLITEDCFYKGYNPYLDNQYISVQSQYIGIVKTAKWFLTDIEVDGIKREQVSSCVKRLIDYFYVNRFCDKPTETSPCTFYYKETFELAKYTDILLMAYYESFLIEIKNSRKDKSLGVPQKSYQLNKLIATLFNLPIARRGILPIGEDMFKAIFSPNNTDNFTTALMKKKQALNAPFGSKLENSIASMQAPSLFDFDDLD